MLTPRTGDTREQILEAATALFSASGLEAVTFDAVASRLGITKQAVIYWFPSKVALLSALALPSLRAEARVAIDAATKASCSKEAARAVVRALIAFHLADLPRFRLLYLSPQVGVTTVARKAAAELVRQIHPVTAEMYAAVAAALDDGPEARATAVALHMAALGHILMVALTDAIGDPLRHEPKILAARLADVLAAGVGYHSEIVS